MKPLEDRKLCWKKVRIYVTINPENFHKLNHLTKLTGLSASEIMRKAIEEFYRSKIKIDIA